MSRVPVLVVTAICATALSGQAALVYYANFESYTTAGSPLSIATNLGGAPDTFTSKTPAGTFTAETAGNPFGTGNYGMATTSATTTATLRQLNVDDFGLGTVRVLSMDMALAPTSSTAVSVTPFFSNSVNASVAAYTSLGLTSANGDLRLTAVYNFSGSAITLPGTLGSLDSGLGTFYYQTEAGVYTTVGTAAITGDGAGFGLSFGGFTPGDAVAFDNIGFWSSASDTLNGTSVLALAPGAVVPEPTTAASILLGSMGFALISRRKRLAA